MGSWGSDDLDWDVALTPDVPLELVFETGASDTRLDLSSLRGDRPSAQDGGQCDRHHAPGGGGIDTGTRELRSGVVVLRVPAGVAARVTGTMGLGRLDVDTARFPRGEGGYASPDFAGAVNRVDIQVEGGVGSVEVRS